MNVNEVEVHLKGKYALFTRPYTRADKVTYPHITPSAAVGVLACILGKPEFNWEITSISLLRYPHQTMNVQVHEHYYRDPRTIENKNPTVRRNYLRNMVVLCDPEYIIRARIVVPNPEPGKRWEGKYSDMFNRRVKNGQCYYSPYFGIRDFDVEFYPVTEESRSRIISMDDDFGNMLYSVERDEFGNVTGRSFFHSIMKQGTINTDPNDISICSGE